MASGSVRALRRTLRYIDEMAEAGYHRDPSTAHRLEVLTRRVSVRVAAAAGELETAACATDAPPELRALAASVRAGNTTWEQCVAGKADHVPEARAWDPVTVRPSRRAPVVEHHDDDDDDFGPILSR